MLAEKKNNDTTTEKRCQTHTDREKRAREGHETGGERVVCQRRNFFYDLFNFLTTGCYGTVRSVPSACVYSQADNPSTSTRGQLANVFDALIGAAPHSLLTAHRTLEYIYTYVSHLFFIFISVEENFYFR
jgi:hypothetical protein